MSNKMRWAENPICFVDKPPEEHYCNLGEVFVDYFHDNASLYLWTRAWRGGSPSENDIITSLRTKDKGIDDFIYLLKVAEDYDRVCILPIFKDKEVVSKIILSYDLPENLVKNLKEVHEYAIKECN